MRRTRSAVQIGHNWPSNVQIAVSNASGQSTGVNQRLSRSGIQFIDYNQALRPPSLSQRRYINAAALVGSLLGSLAQWIGDIGIQRQIRNYLENELVQEVTSILMRGEGVFVIIRLQEWKAPDFQGRRGRGLLDVLIQGGRTQQAAQQAWEHTPHLLKGPPRGWRVVARYGLISTL